MSQIVISDTETLHAWSTVYPELGDVLLPDSRISIIYPSEDEEDQAERVQSLADQHLNDSIPESRFLIYNALSTQWTFTKFQKNPLAYPFLYFFGMIAYACALPIRVAILAFALLRWVIGPFTILCCGRPENFFEEMKTRSIVVLGALGEVGSGTIGVVCPPIAYALDEWIQTHATVYSWYNSHRFSMWSDEVANTSENEERIAQKKEAVKEDVIYFKSAKEDLANHYLSAEVEVDSMSPAAMQLIMQFGFLDLFCSYCNTEIPPQEPIAIEGLAGTPLAQYCTNALEACKEDSVRANTQEGLLGSIEKFRKYWQACHSRTSAKEIWGYLTTAAQVAIHSPRGSPKKGDEINRAIKAVLLLNFGDSVTYNEDDTKESLQAALQSVEEMQLVIGTEKITGKEAVNAMADAIQRFSGTIKSTDREMEGVILRNAYGE